MHFRKILITKADTIEDARYNVSSFMEDYYEKVYDYYSIGGRWSGVLIGKDCAEDEDKDNIIPLKDCIAFVKEAYTPMSYKAQENWDNMMAEYAKDNLHQNTMIAYFAKRYSECVYDYFGEESNVYDIDDNTNDVSLLLETFEEMQKDSDEQFWAIVIDYHN